MKNASLLALTASTATLFTACLFSGESANSPERASVRLEIKAAASVSALAKSAGLILGDSAGVHVELADAKLAVSRIKLESESVRSDCDSSGALKKEVEPGDDSSHETEREDEKERECEEEHGIALKGPFVIDLLTGASDPDLGTLSVPAGTYDKVKIEMHHGQNDSSMGGHTLVAHGTLTLADGSTKPFSLELTFTENLEIRNDSGMTLDAGALNSVAVKLMASEWFKGLDLAPCLAGLDLSAGSIDISEESAVGKCLDVEHTVKENFRGSFHAGEKDEDDHEDEHEGRDSSGHGK